MFYRERQPPDLPRDDRRSPSAARSSIRSRSPTSSSAAGRARGGGRQGLHRLPGRRRADGGQRRVPRARSSARRRSIRRLIEVSTGIVTEAFDGQHHGGRAARRGRVADLPGEPAADERRVHRASRSCCGRRWSASSRCQSGGKTITGVASGFTDLDEMTSGFQPSDLIIVAARPSMGKTAFMLNIAQHAAIENNVPVAFFSLEMSKESLVQRMLTSRGARRRAAPAQGDAARRRPPAPRPRGRHSQLGADLDRRHAGPHAARDALEGAPPQGGGRHRARHRRLPAAHVRARRTAESRQQEVSQISRGLKALAKELERAGHRALAALARARAAHRREQAAAALRPARIGRHRAGRRPRHVHLPPGVLRRSRPTRTATRSKARRGHRRQAAQRSHRHREPVLPQAVHAVRELHAARRPGRERQGQDRLPLHRVRRRPPQVGRPLRHVRRVEHAGRGDRSARPRRRAPARSGARWARARSRERRAASHPRRACARSQGGDHRALGHRPRRIRLRARRRHRARLHGARGRRARASASRRILLQVAAQLEQARTRARSTCRARSRRCR